MKREKVKFFYKSFSKFLVIGGILNEHNDHIEVNGMIFNKPFVEKPVSAENHNVKFNPKSLKFLDKYLLSKFSWRRLSAVI